MKYPRNLKNIEKARSLRRNMTPQERHLWYDFLRYCKPRFRRQEILGCYIVDFFCYEAKLAIEIDGSQHYSPEEVLRDNMRTNYLHTLGIRVLRFSNADINARFANVCEAILLAMEQCNTTAVVGFEE